MDNIWKYTYKNHDKNKNVLLDVINNCPFENINTYEDSISKSDYYLKDVKRPYLNILLNDLKDFQQVVLDHYCCSNIDIIGAWFQQYNSSDVHNWHIHASCNISVVYFLELSNNDSTEFFDLSTRKSFQVENVNEGDLLIFPGFIPHRTPQNKFLDRRTIIAFNLNFGCVNANLLPGGS